MYPFWHKKQHRNNVFIALIAVLRFAFLHIGIGRYSTGQVKMAKKKEVFISGSLPVI